MTEQTTKPEGQPKSGGQPKPEGQPRPGGQPKSGRQPNKPGGQKKNRSRSRGRGRKPNQEGGDHHDNRPPAIRLDENGEPLTQPEGIAETLSLYELQAAQVPELSVMADAYGLVELGALRKHELIFEILKVHARHLQNRNLLHGD